MTRLLRDDRNMFPACFQRDLAGGLLPPPVSATCASLCLMFENSTGLPNESYATGGRSSVTTLAAAAAAADRAATAVVADDVAAPAATAGAPTTIGAGAAGGADGAGAAALTASVFTTTADDDAGADPAAMGAGAGAAFAAEPELLRGDAPMLDRLADRAAPLVGTARSAQRARRACLLLRCRFADAVWRDAVGK